MATHSSILAWKIPQTEEPGGLQSMGSQRVRHDLATKEQPYASYIKWNESHDNLEVGTVFILITSPVRSRTQLFGGFTFLKI